MSDAAAVRELDQALAHVADRLAQRFAGTVSRQTVERCLFEAYLSLQAGAKIASHLLPLAEHEAADRLAELSRNPVQHQVPQVLFLCAYNAGRSQIAAAVAENLGRGRLLVQSAGTDPADRIDETVVAVLDEIGVWLSQAYPKPVTQQMLADADVIVTMGCGDACPVLPGKRYLDWDIVDPAGADLATVRAVRDDISARVRALIDDLTTDGDKR